MASQASDAIWERITRGTFIVAEVGKNFIQTEDDRPVAEYLENAKRLADAAKAAGADAIKFQTHEVEDEQLNISITAPHFKAADRYAWVTRNTRATPVDEFWRPLKEYCDRKGIVFFSTPMSRGAARKLTEVDVPIWKVGSGDILDFVLLDYLAGTGKPIIISSGMSTLEEVASAIRFLQKRGATIALMHALSKYPGELHEANLGTIELYREMFPGIPIGFSENSPHTEPSLIATALGATFVERHFGASRTLWGSDHKVSSTPEEFRMIANGIRAIAASASERARWLAHPQFAVIYGKREKALQPDEAEFRPVFRKSLMAGADIRAGAALTSELIYAMRPQQYAGGLPSERYEEVIGRRIVKSLKKYEPITLAALA